MIVQTDAYNVDIRQRYRLREYGDHVVGNLLSQVGPQIFSLQRPGGRERPLNTATENKPGTRVVTERDQKWCTENGGLHIAIGNTGGAVDQKTISSISETNTIRPEPTQIRRAM